MNGAWGVVMAMVMVAVVLSLVAAVVLVLVLVTRSASGPSGGTVAAPTDSAEQILAERLARGEIDADEYGVRLSALSQRPRP